MINPDIVFVVESSTSYSLYNVPDKQLHRYIERLNLYNVYFHIIYQDYGIKRFTILNDKIIEENIKTQEIFLKIEFVKITPKLFQKLKNNYKFINFCEKYPLNCRKIQNFDLKRFLFLEDYIDKFLDNDIIYSITPHPTETEVNTILNIYKLGKNLKIICFVTPRVVNFSYIKFYFKELNCFHRYTATEFCVINKNLLSKKEYSDLFNYFTYINENSKEYQSLYEHIKVNISHHIQRQVMSNRKSNTTTIISRVELKLGECRFCGKPAMAGSDVCYTCS